jgi:GntR family transcriptional regulator
MGAEVAAEEPRSRAEQVAAALRTAISAGDYPRGSRLPSEDALARQYSVTRPTVNAAERILRAEGLIRTERGRGTVVTEIPVITRQAATRYVRESRERDWNRGAFDAEIRSLGHEPHVDVVVSTAPAPAEVTEALQLEPGTAVVVRERRMYADGVPVQFATSYIPADIAAGTQIAEPDSGPGGIMSRMAELGYAQARITETVRVRPPEGEERAFLRLDKGQAVLEIWHAGWTAAGRPVEVCVHVVPAWQWRLSYELPVT